MTAEEPKKFDLSSMDITGEKRKLLKQIVPEAFTEVKDDEGKVIEALDFERLKSALGELTDVFEQPKERFGMTWPDKNKYQKIIQSSSIATLKPDRSESVSFDEADNLFIEGDNLEVLKLLQRSYSGKVKMIYIDPPYNTGNDFIYPDDYSETLETYLQYTGQIDGEGRKFSANTADSGRFHTKWLNMMYPRLYLAQNLLQENGAIFVSIDDNEAHNLRIVMDEIFGPENFIAEFVVIRSEGGGLAKQVIKGHDYLLVYAKNISEFEPLKRPKDIRGKIIEKDGSKYWLEEDWLRKEFGKYGTCHYEEIEKIKGAEKKKEIDEKINDGIYQLIKKGKGKHVVARLRPLDKDGSKFYSVLKHLSAAGIKDLKALGLGGCYDYPKPVSLIKELTLGATFLTKNSDEIILDFFSGSCTTAHAVLELNKKDGGSRRFIMVQLPEPSPDGSEAAKAGYKMITDIGKERIRRVIKSLQLSKGEKSSPDEKSKHAVGFKVFKLDHSNFKVWNNAPEDSEEAVKEQLKLHVDHINPDATQEDILYELLLKAGFSLTASIEKKEMAGKTVFSIEDGVLLICLEKTLTSEVIRAMAEANPVQVICLDESFAGNDQLKTNAVQTFKSRTTADETHQQIVFRTV